MRALSLALFATITAGLIVFAFMALAMAGDVNVTLNEAQQAEIAAMPTAVRQCVDAAAFSFDQSICKVTYNAVSGLAQIVAKAKVDSDALAKAAADAAAKAKDAPKK